MPPPAKVRRISHTVKEKLAVIKYAEAHGNRQAGREYCVNECSVRQWRRMKCKLEGMPNVKRANRGPAATFPKMELLVFNFISDRRASGIAVSTVEVYLKALDLVKTDPALLNGNVFKASQGWAVEVHEEIWPIT